MSLFVLAIAVVSTCLLVGMLTGGVLALLFVIESERTLTSRLHWKQEPNGETLLIGGGPSE